MLLKREDLLHTGAHKLNNTIGQCLLAKRAGKTRIIAETGAGQHGVASATTAARLGLECVVYMGARDAARQAPNVSRMKLLGARVELVDSGARTLKDAVDEAMRAWVEDPGGSHYVLGSALGPHPFPRIVADFQSVIGREARAQVEERTGGEPDVVVACVGGGSNAIGIFRGFVDDEDVELVGVEAGGDGSRPAPTPRASAAARRESSTGRTLTCSRTAVVRSARPRASARGSTTRPSVPSTRRSTLWVARATERRPTRRRSLRSGRSPSSRGSSPRSSRATPWPGSWSTPMSSAASGCS